MLRSINPKTSKINELTDLSNGQHIRVLRASFNKKRQKKLKKQRRIVIWLIHDEDWY